MREDLIEYLIADLISHKNFRLNLINYQIFNNNILTIKINYFPRRGVRYRKY